MLSTEVPGVKTECPKPFESKLSNGLPSQLERLKKWKLPTFPPPRRRKCNTSFLLPSLNSFILSSLFLI